MSINTHRYQIASFRQTEHCCSTYCIDLPIPVGLKTNLLELMSHEEPVTMPLTVPASSADETRMH